MSNLNPVFGQLTNAVSGSVSNPQELAQLFQDQLQSFANRPDFTVQMGLVFSPNHDYSLLQGNWATGNFGSLPKVEMRSGADLQGANAVYAKETQTIYLSEDFVSQQGNDLSIINSVLLEEFGHYIDDQVNLVDTVGDEGEFFSALVRGESLTEERYSLFKSEDDSGFITLDSNTLLIEKSATPPILYTKETLENIKQGINKLLDDVEKKITEKIDADLNALPLFGEVIKNREEFKLISKIKEKISETFNGISEETISAKSIEEKLETNLNSLLAGLGLDLAGKDILQITQELPDNLEFQIDLSKNRDIAVPINGDISLDAIKLGGKSKGNLNLKSDFNFQFKFGINKDKGFYIDDESDKIGINFNASLNDDFKATGKLGFLQVELTDNKEEGGKKTSLGASFDVNIKDTDNDNRLYLQDLTSLKDLVDTKATGGADVNLDLVTSFNGEKNLPSLTSDLTLKWDPNLKLDPTNPDLLGISQLGLENVKLDLGSFFGFANNTALSKVKSILEPVEKVTNFLTKKNKLLGFEFTFLQLLREAEINNKPVIDADDEKFIQSIDKLSKLVLTVSKLSESDGLFINYGDYNLINNTATPNSKLNDDIKNSSPDVGGFFDSLSEMKDFGLTFPILTEPQQVFNLLLGDADKVNLFQYDLPKFGFEFSYRSEPITIFGPIVARLEGIFNAEVNLSFGFDAKGFMEFSKSNEAKDLLDGFFINDRIIDGKDLPELTLGLGFNAYGAVNFAVIEGGVGGGILAQVYFDLNDVEKDGKIRTSEFTNLLSNPESMFRISGDVSAGLSAYYEIDFGFWSKRKTFDSPRIILLKFGSSGEEEKPSYQLAQNESGKLRLNIGPYAKERKEINNEDGKESVYITHRSGKSRSDEVIQVSVSFPDDKKNDGKPTIVSEEYNAGSQIVASGGEFDDLIDLGYSLDENLNPIFVLTNASLSGGAGNDKIAGGSGKDVLNGDEGDDVLSGGLGADTFNGGDNDDIATYINSRTAINLDFSTGNHQGEAEGDVFIDIEEIIGSTFPDVFIGDNTKNVFSGEKDNDSINGNGGNDELSGDEGNDSVGGDDGEDIIEGNAGNDKLSGGNGNDSIFGYQDTQTFLDKTQLNAESKAKFEAEKAEH